MPLSPYQMVTIAAGMATARVIRRRIQGGSLMCRKPSIVIWPASVAVTVELMPQHKNAMRNKVGAMARPSSGASSECASIARKCVRPPRLPRRATSYSPCHPLPEQGSSLLPCLAISAGEMRGKLPKSQRSRDARSLQHQSAQFPC